MRCKTESFEVNICTYIHTYIASAHMKKKLAVISKAAFEEKKKDFFEGILSFSEFFLCFLFKDR